MKKMLALLLIIAMVGLVACSGGKSDPSSPPNKKSEPEEVKPDDGGKPYEGKTLTVLYMSSVYADAARAIVPEFEGITGAKVDVVDFPYVTLHEKALLDLTSGST